MAVGVPALIQRFAGSRITAAVYQQDITDTATFLTNPPTFLGIQTVVQSTTTGVWAAISLDTHQYDTYGGHSDSVNNSRYTCQSGVPGYYIAAGVSAFANSGSGARESALAVNGTRLSGTAGLIAPSSSDGGVVVTAVREVFLNVGDYIELHAIQDSGGGLNTKSSGEIASALWVRWSHG